ncbi:MAG: WecB/TagA/CpsF family glycosyltransferase [Butyrivibrio sp.]|nr:WecB/TagA/CpsF family glycosyltransferase [Butyrivibrio sp.]
MANQQENRIYRRRRDLIVWDTVGVCATTKAQFIQEVFSMPTTPVSATVDLVGVPAVISSIEDPQLRKMYNRCTFAAIDGMPIVKMARKQGLVCERCAAPDIMGLVFAESIRQGKTHYFYGGADETVLKRLRARLEKDYPGIRIAGMYSPPFRPLTAIEDRQLCEEINRLHPDFIWVGIGAPKQELWMADHQEKLHGAVMLGVGAGFNFFAGTLAKAPRWMENAGIEWIFRLIKEPRRLWKRYLIGGMKFLFYSFRFRGKHRQHKADA